MHSRHFLLLWLSPADSAQTHTRFGVTVSTKTEKRANRRNRIKRLLRELFRLHQHEFKKAVDLVIIARQGAADLTYAEVEKEVLTSLRRKNLLT
jgi:ribonuclease P protein component